MKNEILGHLIGGCVYKVYLAIFPPYGEHDFQDIDMRLGLAMQEQPERIVQIGTDLRDIWTPTVEICAPPDTVFQGEQLECRMKQWMNREIDSNFHLEYYDMSERHEFRSIAGCEVMDYRLLMIEGNQSPFGVRLYFPNDYILSFPNVDGNTIETSKFNPNCCLRRFAPLGNVVEASM